MIKILRAIKRYIKTYGLKAFTKQVIDKFKNREIINTLKNNTMPRDTFKSEIKNIVTQYSFPNNISEIEELIFPKFDNPAVSIIIPVYNSWMFTYNCLKSILNNTKNYSYEVIVADDNSTDETPQLFEKVKNVNYIINKKNIGFINNCNSVSKFAQGRYILFLNNDTIVLENWIDGLVETMERDPKIGLVGPKFVFSDGRLQEAGGIIWNDGTGWNFGRFDDPSKPEYNYVKNADYISGACMFIRKTIWEEVGGFDELFAPAYYEDTDLAFDIRKRGYSVVYQPRTTIIHFEGASNGINLKSGVKKYQTINRQKFLQKYKSVLQNEHFKNSTNVFWARDRSKNKKTILFIDHYVPTWDKDAGSMAAFSYLKLFVELGFNVKFLGDNFLKLEPYTAVLQQMGIEVLYGEYYANHLYQWIKDNNDKIDYIILSRPHITIKHLNFFKQYAKGKLVYLGHDLNYLRELREYHILNDERHLLASQKMKKTELKIMNKVDISYFFSFYEIEELKKKFPKIKAKCIPLHIFDDAPEIYYNAAERKNLLFVGGFAHRPNADAVLWFAKNIFPEVIKDINTKDVKLFVVGSNPPKKIKQLNSDRVIVTGYVTEEELRRYYNACRIAIAPLRYGAGVKGKIVEAMYYQVPVLTTKIGAEGLAEPDEHLTICDLDVTMAYKIQELYSDFDKLNSISKKYKEYIEKYFTKEAAVRTLKEDLKI